ncbi:PSD1 and planctomycete cytochrome C domain-containing protein [Stieleria sp. JC731]|uniref:PSD1 and planctomycete cytochrome C domain-containing protein n=1 Tax=Pirellulaceae TaxID=2691357 RepID=UPI001E2F1087|nr:PSD1 and planctomycete cytochrome C domain-containing protein [Stieleria sp. JC731]MCC9602415.1 PSD1 and planctomycete cytochrome C domain-containing protein [Stieleria sp. JC731]
MVKHSIAISHFTKVFVSASAIVGLFLSSMVVAADEAALKPSGNTVDSPIGESEAIFVRRIETLIRDKCLGCHGADQDAIEGELDLRNQQTAFAGGESGEAAVIAGHPEKSPLYLVMTRTSDDWSAMPPKDAEAVTEEQLGYVHRWIETGAVWPSKDRIAEIQRVNDSRWSVEDGVTVKTSGGLDQAWTNRRYQPESLWAYQPLQKPDIADGPINPIDQLINHAMPDGLSPAGTADRRVFIRRATYDLTGLPPTPEEVQSFLDDSRSDDLVVADLVDRLLRSKHYGERMAQHWLDVVRYADSSGFANDFHRGGAWRYRDYVIRSFNQDKAYDRFVMEQIAGDELDPNDPEMRIAVGFLRMGPWELTGMEVAKVARQRFLDDVTNSVGETFLAHSLQCAKCHDHKFDPVPTRDYYSIQAVFQTTQLADRRAERLQNENVHGFDQKRYLDLRRADYQQAAAQLDEALLANAIEWYKENDLDDSQWRQIVSELKDQRKSSIFNSARNQIKKGLREDEYPPKLVGFTPQQFGLERVARKGLQALAFEEDTFKPFALSVYNGHTPDVKSISSPFRVPSDTLKGELEKGHILTGGDPFSPGQAVSPGVLSVLGDLLDEPIEDSVGGRRLGFAKWVANPKNPLTTRAIANRIWMWHFGQPIAGNPNNFGSTGKLPTHPELLDYLAVKLVEDGWSIKTLHRLIMNSQAYRRSSAHPDTERLVKLDPNLNHYAVFQPRRLTAEEIRDSMLAMTNELNPEMGGVPCRPEINLEVALQPRQIMGTFAAAWQPNPLPADRHRRSIYACRLRGLADPAHEVFNMPGPDFSSEKRDQSNVTPQVFALLNSERSHKRALALAHRCLKETESDGEAIDRCYQLVYGRLPNDRERRLLLEHMQTVEQMLPDKPVPFKQQPTEIRREAVEENTGEQFSFVEVLHSNEDFVPDLQPTDVDRHTRAFADLCLAILNSNEFIYIY